MNTKNAILSVLFLILLSNFSFSQEKIFHENGNLAYNPFTDCVYFKTGKIAYTPNRKVMTYPNDNKMYSSDYKNIYYPGGGVVFNYMNKNLYYPSGTLAYKSIGQVIIDEKGERIFSFSDENNTKQNYTFNLEGFKIEVDMYNQLRFECTVNDSSLIYKTDFNTYYKIISPKGETLKEIRF